MNKNFPPLLLLSFKKRSSLALLAVAYSYILLIGFEFVERFSLLATGYQINYFSQLGLKIDYLTMNLSFSLLFSLLAGLTVIIALWGQETRLTSFLRSLRKSSTQGDIS